MLDIYIRIYINVIVDILLCLLIDAFYFVCSPILLSQSCLWFYSPLPDLPFHNIPFFFINFITSCMGSFLAPLSILLFYRRFARLCTDFTVSTRYSTDFYSRFLWPRLSWRKNALENSYIDLASHLEVVYDS